MTSVTLNPWLQPPEKPQGSGLYTTSSDAPKAVRDDYHYWTGKLTDSSFQLSLAVIAANWPVFSSASGILCNWWAKLSIALVPCINWVDRGIYPADGRWCWPSWRVNETQWNAEICVAHRSSEGFNGEA